MLHQDSVGSDAAGAARGAEPDDRRARHRPRRDVDAVVADAARRAAVGGAARPRARHAPGVRAPRALPVGRGRPASRSRSCSAGSATRCRRRRRTAPSWAPTWRSTAGAPAGAARAGVRARGAGPLRRPGGRRRAAAKGPLLYLGCGRDRSRWRAAAAGAGLLLGGEPFDEELLMWWNFVGRDHDEVEAVARGVAAAVGGEEQVRPGRGLRRGRAAGTRAARHAAASPRAPVAPAGTHPLLPCVIDVLRRGRTVRQGRWTRRGRARRPRAAGAGRRR